MKQNARDARTPWSLARPGQSESHVMKFCIADSFTNALGELPAQEQKAVKTSAFDLQTDPSAPGLSFHRIDRSKDPHLWRRALPDHRPGGRGSTEHSSW